jgi:hypothetical protein
VLSIDSVNEIYKGYQEFRKDIRKLGENGTVLDEYFLQHLAGSLFYESHEEK